MTIHLQKTKGNADTLCGKDISNHYGNVNLKHLTADPLFTNCRKCKLIAADCDFVQPNNQTF